MRYANASKAELNFQIGGQSYKVPAGGHCHISDRFAYAVEAYGLKLVAVGEPDFEPPLVEPPPAFEAEEVSEEPSEEDMLDELTRPDPDPPKKTRGKGFSS